MNKRIIKRFEMVASTNATAMELARDGAVSGTLVVADAQSQGRGRLQRQWLSPPGTGLYFSMILRPQLPCADLPFITLAAGVALCEAITASCSISTGMKWPNDLLVNGRKVGGILCESEPGSDGSYVVILGIGVNVTTPALFFPAEISGKSSSLLIETGQIFSRKSLMTSIVKCLDTVLHRLESGDLTAVLADWRRFDCMVGRQVTWVAVNREQICGIAVGLNADGTYSIQASDGALHQVLSGDVSLAQNAEYGRKSQL